MLILRKVGFVFSKDTKIQYKYLGTLKVAVVNHSDRHYNWPEGGDGSSE